MAPVAPELVHFDDEEDEANDEDDEEAWFEAQMEDVDP